MMSMAKTRAVELAWSATSRSLVDGENELRSIESRKGVAKGQLKRASSLRAVPLLDDLFERDEASATPRDFEHHCGNFIGLFDRYIAQHVLGVSYRSQVSSLSKTRWHKCSERFAMKAESQWRPLCPLNASGAKCER